MFVINVGLFSNILLINQYYSVKVRPKVEADVEVLGNINNQIYKPRQHPGIIKPRLVKVPEQFLKSVKKIVEDNSVKRILTDSKKLARILQCRHPPIEADKLKETQQNVIDRVKSQIKEEPQTETEEQKYKQKLQNKVNNILLKTIYNWKPIKYDTHNSLVYLFARFAAEYSVLTKIFSEIASRDPQFQPRSLFDFGSGVGSVSWASKNYWTNIFEYFNVDSSRDMNDLAEVLLKGGKNNSEPLKGVFYRQFLPASNTNYDLVVAAYSMFELPSLQTRLETILNLWNKTSGYLVVVEHGTNAGFKIINEIRDFILQLNSDCHVFSPCSHDDLCPRFVSEDGTPCNFEVNHYTLPIAENSTILQERYSYVVIKRGKRNELEGPAWPRIVRPTLVRSKHTICRLCTYEGQLQEVIFTAKKHGKECYHCARASKWGDLVPIKLNPNESL